MPTTRRTLLKTTAAVGLTTGLSLSTTVLGQSKPKVVVIGAGAGGATVAKYVAKSGAVDVTLIEANADYTSCFFSNLYLGGFRSFESITHSFDTLKSEYGIDVVIDRATGIDGDAKTVKTAGGQSYAYDRLVVAPGIDFRWDTIDGYDATVAETIPHAYLPGAQTQLLKTQIDNVPDGGTFVIATPPNPFRCPPGPYERVSMIAHAFKQNKPKSKIIIVDSKDKFSKQGLFQSAWDRFFPDMIEWLPAEITSGGIKAVNAGAMEIVTEDETFKADAANVIPAQYAGAIARDSGLGNDSGWCPVTPDTLESTLIQGVHLVGDAIVPGDMPKSGFSANSQAKVCANAILAELTDSRKFPAKFRNTCWSLVTTDHGIKVGANYEATDEKISKTDGFISKGDEDDATRKATSDEANTWYANMTADMFG